MTNYVYHGRSPSDPAWEDSSSGFIEANPHTIFQVDIPDPEEEREYRAQNIYNLPGRVTGKRNEYIAGGLTNNIGAAVKFHKSFSELGAVFAIERTRLEETIEPIQYDYDWATAHPGTYARVDSMDEFEIYAGDMMIGAGYFQAGSDDPIVNKWGRDRMAERVNDFVFADEAELACWGCSRINFTSALEGTATIAHTEKHLGGSIQGALKEYDSIRPRDLRRMDGEEGMAKEFHNTFTSQSVWSGDVIGSDHWVLLYGKPPDESLMRELKDASTHVPREQFVLATDGDYVTRDPKQLPPWLPVK